MTECQEVAESIWRARSTMEGSGLNVTMPIRTYADAERVAAHWCEGESYTIKAEIAEALWRFAQARK